jgi:uncharacterized repeat protein (TIGR01451 family)
MRELRRATPWLAAILAAGLGLTGLALAVGPQLEVGLEGKIRAAGQHDGWQQMADEQRVQPGDRILYTVSLRNVGDSEARSPLAFGPVPAGTVYLEDAATTGPGLQVEFSINGGKTFSPQPMVVVTAADGSQRTVPAPVDRYTTIRWSWDASLAAGEQQVVSYQVQVR